MDKKSRNANENVSQDQPNKSETTDDYVVKGWDSEK